MIQKIIFSILLITSTTFAASAQPEPKRLQDFLTAVEINDLTLVKNQLKKHPELLQAANADGSTALSVAAESGEASVALFLLDQGAKTQGVFGKDNEPLSVIAIRGNNVNLMEKLMLKDPTVLTYKDSQNETLLFQAVKVGSPSMTKLLVSKGLSPSAKNKAGETPVTIAEKLKFSKVLESLQTKN